jgi:uncharacterized membrane protein
VNEDNLLVAAGVLLAAATFMAASTYGMVGVLGWCAAALLSGVGTWLVMRARRR